MPRGFKRDTKLTKRLLDNGLLIDKRSFIGYDTDVLPHLLLFGEDLAQQRTRAFNKAKGKCAICGNPIIFATWELDHIQGGLSGRCDCLHNLRCLHISCHVKKHNRYPKFGASRPQDIAEFEKVQGP